MFVLSLIAPRNIPSNVTQSVAKQFSVEHKRRLFRLPRGTKVTVMQYRSAVLQKSCRRHFLVYEKVFNYGIMNSITETNELLGFKERIKHCGLYLPT